MLELLFWGALMLGLSIFIHEFGHYLLGRLVGVEAEIFSIGYGRGIWKKKIGVTTWQITAFPIGGYVKYYGDDIYKQDSSVPGGFFSVPPLVRIIPVLGGPLFNLLLGALLFITLHLLTGPVAPIIDVSERGVTAAREAGLRDGDRVISINGKEIHSFDDISQQVRLSGGKALRFVLERKEQGKSRTLTKEVSPIVDESGVAYVGVRPMGKVYVHVNFPLGEVISYRLRSLIGNPEPETGLRALPYLHDGDVILKVEGREVHSVEEIQRILGQRHGQQVKVTVLRERFPLLSWRWKKVVTVEMPSSPEYMVHFTKITDLYYNEDVPDATLRSYVPEHERGLAALRINGEPPRSFAYLAKHYGGSKKQVNLTIDKNAYRAQIEALPIGLLGFIPSPQIEMEYLPPRLSLKESLGRAFGDLIASIMVYPRFFASIFAGRMSFIENAAGPVKIIGIAGMVARSDWRMYLKIFASISIALFVMNLLPFPVLDGGHLVFFLYEAVRGKPLPPKVLEQIYRLGFSLLLFFGLYIMYRDVLWSLGI